MAKEKVLLFFKRMFFCFCSFLVLLAIMTVLMYAFLPKDFIDTLNKTQSEYDLAITLFLYIAFCVSYFVIIAFEKLLKK